MPVTFRLEAVILQTKNFILLCKEQTVGRDIILTYINTGLKNM